VKKPIERVENIEKKERSDYWDLSEGK